MSPVLMARDTGVLLVNLGTPSAPTPAAIRRFLAEFLRDRRVVKLTPWLWYPILYGFILPFRPARLAHAYQKIWTGKESPLLTIGRQQAQKLGEILPNKVGLAMRYGKPSIAAALSELQTAGINRVLVLPLYPQYSGTTTESVFDGVKTVIKKKCAGLELRYVKDYHDDAGYIGALADGVRRHWASNGRARRLLISFHSIPQQYVDAGDPYRKQCEHTARLLAEQLQLEPDDWFVSYQSRLGRAPWLQPYTDIVLADWGKQGRGDIDVIAPGFSADCLETLEEICIRYVALYRNSGGRTLRYIPALNDDDAHINALASLVKRHMQDWA